MVTINKKEYFHIGGSKFQGYLLILKNLSNNKLFVFDDAMELEWNDIEEAVLDNKDITSLSKPYEYSKPSNDDPAEPATWEEIKAAGWDKYVTNKPSDSQ